MTVTGLARSNAKSSQFCHIPKINKRVKVLLLLSLHQKQKLFSKKTFQCGVWKDTQKKPTIVFWFSPPQMSGHFAFLQYLKRCFLRYGLIKFLWRLTRNSFFLILFSFLLKIVKSLSHNFMNRFDRLSQSLPWIFLL